MPHLSSLHRLWRFCIRFSVLAKGFRRLFWRFCGFGRFFSSVLRFLIHPNAPSSRNLIIFSQFQVYCMQFAENDKTAFELDIQRSQDKLFSCNCILCRVYYSYPEWRRYEKPPCTFTVLTAFQIKNLLCSFWTGLKISYRKKHFLLRKCINNLEPNVAKRNDGKTGKAIR